MEAPDTFPDQWRRNLRNECPDCRCLRRRRWSWRGSAGAFPGHWDFMVNRYHDTQKTTIKHGMNRIFRSITWVCLVLGGWDCYQAYIIYIYIYMYILYIPTSGSYHHGFTSCWQAKLDCISRSIHCMFIITTSIDTLWVKQLVTRVNGWTSLADLTWFNHFKAHGPLPWTSLHSRAVLIAGCDSTDGPAAARRCGGLGGRVLPCQVFRASWERFLVVHVSVLGSMVVIPS